MVVSLSRPRGLLATAVVLLALLAGLTALAPAAGAAPYPPSNPPSVSASAYDPCAGASNIIGGTGYQPGETVLLDLAETGEVGRAVVRADGTFELTITIPLAARGSDQLTVVGLTSGTTVTIRFDIPCVLGDSATRIDASGGGLAYTGVAVGGVLLLAAVLLGTGVVITVAGRRRRGATPAS